MDASSYEAVGVETVEDAAEPIPKSKSTWCERILGQACRWDKCGDVADVENATSPSSVEQGVLAACRFSKFSGTV